MGIIFPSLPLEIHHEISSYLTAVENQKVSQCCSSLRELYRTKSWKFCIVIRRDREKRDIKFHDARVLPLRVLHNPTRYKKWFTPQYIKAIKFNIDMYRPSITRARMSLGLNRENIKYFKSLKHIDVNNTEWNQVPKLIEPNIFETEDNIEISSVKLSTFGQYNIETNFNHITSMSIISLREDNMSIASRIIMPTNLTKLAIYCFPERDIEQLCIGFKSLVIPNIKDFSLGLEIPIHYEADNAWICINFLKVLKSINLFSFIKYLERFELMLQMESQGNILDHGSEGECNADYLPTSGSPYITLPYVTHVNLRKHNQPADSYILCKCFDFPNLTHLLVKDLKTMQLPDMMANWESIFSKISFLTICIVLDQFIHHYHPCSIDYLDSFKKLVNLKVLKIDFIEMTENNTDLFLRPIGKLSNVIEGSFFTQLCNILKFARSEFSPNITSTFSRKLLDKICAELPFVEPIEEYEMTSQGETTNMENYQLRTIEANIEEYTTPFNVNINELRSISEYCLIRGFFISSIQQLIEFPNEFLQSFPTKFTRWINTFDASPSELNEFQKFEKKYLENLGKMGEPKYRTLCDLHNIAYFLCNVAYCESLFSSFYLLEKLEYLQITSSIDLIPSPRLDRFLNSSRSLRQVTIISRIKQPFDGMAQYLDDNNLNIYLGPQFGTSLSDIIMGGNDPITSSIASTFTEGEILKIKKLIKRIFKIRKYEDSTQHPRVVGIDSIDTDIFPQALGNSKRDIFWTGLVAECSHKAKRRNYSPDRVNCTYSSALAFYSFDKSTGEFNKTIDFKKRFNLNRLINLKAEIGVVEMINLCFDENLTFDGWV